MAQIFKQSYKKYLNSLDKEVSVDFLLLKTEESKLKLSQEILKQRKIIFNLTAEKDNSLVIFSPKDIYNLCNEIALAERELNFYLQIEKELFPNEK